MSCSVTVESWKPASRTIRVRPLKAVKDLLVYARPRPPELRPCDLRTIITRVLNIMRDAPALRRVQVKFDPAETMPPVAADAGQIEQLVMNLVVNAAQASRRDDTVTICLSTNGECVRMAITDKGHGMDGNIHARAFEPFFTTKAKGTGLGLPICKKIVDAHGGIITLSSAVGEGTEVIVELPVDLNDQEIDQAVS